MRDLRPVSTGTEKRRRAAAALIRRGVAVIPVPAGEKNPGRPGWEALRIAEEEIPHNWTNGQNVGLLCGKPSGWRVDVDLDADEAVKIAGRFLPPTLTSGRESRPHSHWWFVASGAESSDWKDVGGKKLVELRSTGRQTIVAPSTHPDGDEYVWHSEAGLKMSEMPAAELRERCRELATAALIARHVPTEGSRHDYAMALAGFVLRGGRMEADLALKVFKAAWYAAGADTREALRDLEGIVSDTAENLAAGEPVVGGPTLEEYAPGIVRLLCKWWGWERKAQTENKAEEKEDRRNQADRLIGYALEDVQDLFVDQHGASHALIDGEPVPLTSRCYSWLRRLMWEEEGRSVSGEYLKMAAGTLSAHAEFSGESRELYTRAAWHEGALYYELRPGKVARVGAGGWTFEGAPVLFRRYANLKALPDPEAGGSLSLLDELVNLKSERDRRLFKAYLVTLPLEHVGRPIFNASGAMGSGKTSIQRLIKRLLDPTAPETVRFDPRDFLQKAMHAYIVMLDNQNTIPEWAADTLCRLVTGEADSKRRLYTDDEDFIIELRRVVLLNGINVPTDRGDVLDRSLVVELERIPDGDRKTEEQIWELFAREHPGLLGALFDVLSKAIALKASLKLSRRPRLADWGEYAAAIYEVMGWGAETFLKDWDEVVRVQNQATLDGSPAAQAIIKFMEERPEYTGTSSELHSKLKVVAATLGVDVDRDKAWPKSARWLWRRIKEVLPLLVAAGIEANRMEDRSGSKITLRKMPKNVAIDATGDEHPTGKANTRGNTDGDDATSNATTAPNATANATRKPADRAESGISGGNSGIRSGTSWENDPMRHYGRKGGAS
jgi:Bifunctional DNA primase/polymerase, N-terminal